MSGQLNDLQGIDYFTTFLFASFQSRVLSNIVLLRSCDRDHCVDVEAQQERRWRAGWSSWHEVLNGGHTGRPVANLPDYEQFRGLRGDQGILRAIVVVVACGSVDFVTIHTNTETHTYVNTQPFKTDTHTCK